MLSPEKLTAGRPHGLFIVPLVYAHGYVYFPVDALKELYFD